MSSDIILLSKLSSEDPAFKEKLQTILELESFNRRSALILWLELLRLQKMPEPMIDALSILFDDRTASKMLELINKQFTTYNSIKGGMS